MIRYFDYIQAVINAAIFGGSATLCYQNPSPATCLLTFVALLFCYWSAKLFFVCFRVMDRKVEEMKAAQLGSVDLNDMLNRLRPQNYDGK